MGNLGHIIDPVVTLLVGVGKWEGCPRFARKAPVRTVMFFGAARRSFNVFGRPFDLFVFGRRCLVVGQVYWGVFVAFFARLFRVVRILFVGRVRAWISFGVGYRGRRFRPLLCRARVSTRYLFIALVLFVRFALRFHRWSTRGRFLSLS